MRCGLVEVVELSVITVRLNVELAREACAEARL